MHSLSLALNLLLASAAVAVPQGADIFRRASCNAGQQSAYSCISSAGQAAAASTCASYISTKTSTVSFKATVTSTITSTSTRGDTVTTKAPTSTSTSTFFVNALATTTTTDATSFTATVSTTTTVSTATSTVTSTTTSYTCAGAVVTSINPVKRQLSTTCTVNPASISGACNNCGGTFVTPTSTLSSTSTSTRFTTTVIRVTNFATSTPIKTATTTVSTTSTITSHATLSTDTTTTFSVTATSFTTTTTTVFAASPTPSTFNLYYVDAVAQATHVAVQRASPGGSGIMVGFSTTDAGSVYSIDANNAIVDTITGQELATNAVDEYPFLFDGVVAGRAAPTCNACGGLVTCTSNSLAGGANFAVCDGFLALGTTFGPDGNGVDSCTPITLMFAATQAATQMGA